MDLSRQSQGNEEARREKGIRRKGRRKGMITMNE